MFQQVTCREIADRGAMSWPFGAIHHLCAQGGRMGIQPARTQSDTALHPLGTGEQRSFPRETPDPGEDLTGPFPAWYLPQDRSELAGYQILPTNFPF